MTQTSLTAADDPASSPSSRRRIAAGESIEPKDWMPERYRRQLVRMMSQHAHSEIVGMLPEGNWITRAPACAARCRCIAKVQDEAGHGLYIYCGTETLGVDRAELIQQLLDGTAKYSSIFNYPTLSWADIGVHRLVRRRRGDRQPDDAREGVVRPVCARDDPHLQGRELPQAAGLRDRRDARQRHAGAEGDGAGRREPLVVAVADDVRPAATPTRRTAAELMRWRVKRKTNDELRQRFVNLTVPQAAAVNLTLPDPDLAYDEETENWNSARSTGTNSSRCCGQRPVQPRASRGAPRGARRGRVGARGGERIRGEAARKQASEAA